MKPYFIILVSYFKIADIQVWSAVKLARSYKTLTDSMVSYALFMISYHLGKNKVFLAYTAEFLSLEFIKVAALFGEVTHHVF